jgi:hypothetical protein
MPEPAHRRSQAHLAVAAALLAVAALAFVLDRFPPETSSFYPRCPIYALTGWQCPGCGMTRALAALLHGRMVDALHWNPLAPFLVAALAVWALAAYRRALTGKPVSWPRLSNRAVAALLLVACAFTLLRNLPL